MTNHSTTQEVLLEITKAGLGHLGRDVEGLIANSIRLRTRSATLDSLPVGASRIGGLPDLPPSVAWPEGKGNALSFLAQVNLMEVSRFDSAHLLPSEGILYFFYDAKGETYGSDPADRGGWQVLFYAGNLADLHRTESPADLTEQARFGSCSVTPELELMLPQRPSLYNAALNWTKADSDAYANLVANFSDHNLPNPFQHRLLGYPDEIQDDMREQVAVASLGLKPGTPEAALAALEWRLLFQLDSDDKAKMRWGSSGMLYFWIERQSLLDRKFDQVWVVLQSE